MREYRRSAPRARTEKVLIDVAFARKAGSNKVCMGTCGDCL